MSHRSTAVPAALAALGLATALHADPPAYTVEFLGPTLLVTDLNGQGWAAGQTIQGAVVSWVWTPQGGFQLLGPLDGAAGTQARDINEAGTIVGTSGGLPVLWEHQAGVYGSPTPLPILPDHSGGIATAINDVGDIVGVSTNGGFQRATLFTAPGGPQDLVPLGFWPMPAAISNARLVCGHDLVLDLHTGQVTDLGVPEGPPSFIFTIAADINDAGQVCSQGVLATSLPDDRLPVRFTPDAGWELLMSQPTPYASATSINALGDCGISYVKAVHLEGEGLLAPGDLLAPSVQGWNFGGSYGIEYSVVVNDRRQLLTTASNAGLGVGGAVLLTPTNLTGDVNGDLVTDVLDLVAVIQAWGTTDAAADCTMDGVVNVLDLVAVVAGWS